MMMTMMVPMVVMVVVVVMVMVIVRCDFARDSVIHPFCK